MITSYDSLLQSLWAGRKKHTQWNKVTGAAAYTAGRCYDLSMLDGSPMMNDWGSLVKNGQFNGWSAEWTLGANWSWTIGTNLVTKTTGGANGISQTLPLLETGVQYTVIWTLAGYSGTWAFTVTLGWVAGTARSANGTYTETITPTTGQVLDISAVSTAGGTIDNVSVYAQRRFIPYKYSTNQGGIYHGGAVEPTYQKHLSYISAKTPVATAVGTYILVDILGVYSRIDMNSASSQTLNNTNTLPRYTTGEDVQAYLVTTTATWAVAHNFVMNYTNELWVASRNLWAIVSLTVSAIVWHISHTGVAANNFQPFLPLQGEDGGIRSVQSVQLSAASGSAGFASLVLAKPLAEIEVTTAGILYQNNLAVDFPSLPDVPDDAYLAWIFCPNGATAASSTIWGAIRSIWW